jgi:hypothetical protein
MMPSAAVHPNNTNLLVPERGRKGLKSADIASAQRDGEVLQQVGTGPDRAGSVWASHYWARLLRGLGHEVVCFRRNTSSRMSRVANDANDPEPICEAMSRPEMRFMPIKSAERQAELMLLGVRDLLIKQRTTVIIRSMNY